ncbi:MAG: dephospho-CoA kinase [Rubricoccaceae bacterium]
MIALGIAGGIGSGKTAFARRLGTHPGVRVVYADEVARALMHDDPAVRGQLVRRFGEDVFDGQGRLDRAALAARVFADAAEREALNAIVHPAVRSALREALRQAEADGVRLFVYEAALLFEVGGDRLMDVTALVDAPPALRLARAAARDGADPEQIRARMAAQMDPAAARARATFVVDNSGDLGALHAQADALYRRLTDPDA